METLIILGFIMGIVVGAMLMSAYEKKIYFNSNAHKIVESDEHLSKFEVVAIEQSEDIDYRSIAKYTVRNCFFAKKNNKNFKYQTFYFYDTRDKYVIGQTLTLK